MGSGNMNDPEGGYDKYLDDLAERDYDKYLDEIEAHSEAWARADLEAQAREIKACKVGDLLEVTARIDDLSGWYDPIPETLLPEGQVYRAQALKGRGWDLVLVSGNGPPELRIMNGEIPQFFRVLPS